MLGLEIFEETAKTTIDAIKDKVYLDLIIKNRAAGNAPMVAQEIAVSLRRENLKKLLESDFALKCYTEYFSNRSLT